MSAEDETFRILSRPSLQEMRNKYIEYMSQYWGEITVGSRKKFFLENGWTVQEFVDKHHELGIRLPHD